MVCGPPGSSVHGILWARIPEWFAISFSRGSSLPRDWTWVSCIGRWILYQRTIMEAFYILYYFLKLLVDLQCYVSCTYTARWFSLYINLFFLNFLSIIVYYKILNIVPCAFLVAQSLKRLPAMRKTGFDPWVGKTPWRRKWQPTPVVLPGGLQSTGPQRVRHGWATSLSLFLCYIVSSCWLSILCMIICIF